MTLRLCGVWFAPCVFLGIITVACTLNLNLHWAMKQMDVMGRCTMPHLLTLGAGACTKAREVRARLQSGPAVTETEVEKLQSLVSLVGRNLHPLAPSSERSAKVLRFLHQHPEIIEQRLADHLFLSCIGLHHDRCLPSASFGKTHGGLSGISAASSYLNTCEKFL